MRAPGRGRASLARVVTVSGLVSAAALVWAALSLTPDPTEAGRVARERLGGELAASVETAWVRHRRAAPPEVTRLGPELGWIEGRMAPPPAATARPTDVAPDDTDALGALLEEAARLERIDGDDEAALELVLESLEVEPDPASRGRARLRAIQLAGRVGRVDVVRAQWSTVLAELDGAETEHDVSLLLQCGLAAAPRLEPAERATVLDVLVEAWLDGRLALPGGPPTLALDGWGAGALRWSARQGALWLRLVDLAEGLAAHPGAGLAVTIDEAEATLLVRAVHGALGVEPDAPSPPELWSVTRVGDAVLRSVPARGARDPGGRPIAGTLHRPGLVALAFEAWLGDTGVLGDGFRLVEPELFTAWREEAAGRPEREAPVALGRVELDGLELTRVIHHPDPAGLVAAEVERVGMGRLALLGLALLTLVAAFATARALARERALAEARTAFVASVSHELRTPVSSILLMAENLEDGRVSAEARGRYHALIRREALRLRRLVDDVLDFSRLERGRAPALHLEAVAPSAFVESLARDVEAHVAAAGGCFACEVGALPGSAALDTEALRRAVLNLVDNALRHSGSDDVALLAGPDAERPDRWRLAVADRGRGIPPERRAEVFEPFRRLRAGGGASGAGLGLAIVRQIATGHGGEARVTDRDDGAPGAVFALLLPAAWPTEAGAGDESAARARPPAARTPAPESPA